MRLAPRHLGLPVLGLATILAAALSATPQDPVPGIVQEGAALPSGPGNPPKTLLPQTTVENGTVCTTIDFEGVGDQRPIPEFDGIRSPDWLGVIDFDAGGGGNFAHEPSPSTIAFWLGGATGTGSSRDIVLDQPAAVVDFFYASAVTTRMEAFDDRGRRVATATGAANFGRGPGGDPTGQYNRWDRLRLEVDENRISRIRVFGAINQTGIDDLKVCRRNGVDAVEFTQAIQQLQDLDDLKADLASNGEPPVPIVRSKMTSMRVYFREVHAKTELRLEADLGGRRETRTVTLVPGCTREKMRLQDGCASADFDFVPSAAQVPIELVVKDASGRQIENHQFRLRTRQAEPLVLSAVKVCDTQDAAGNWQCAENYRTRLPAIVGLLRRIAPTHSVRVVDSGETVRREIDTDGDGTVTTGDGAEDDAWWTGAAGDLRRLGSFFDGLRDGLGLEDRRYYGMTRAAIPGGTQGIAYTPSRGALSRTQARLFGRDASEYTVAHETFHTMGRPHTSTAAPRWNGSYGCAEADPGADWPYPDNRIRSGNRGSHRLEVGYDLATKKAFDPRVTFDVMGYCSPGWISAFTYVQVLEDELAKTARKAAPRATAQGRFWLLSGGVLDGELRLEPIYEIATIGPTDAGMGPYRIEVRGGGGRALFTRRFLPTTPKALTDGTGRFEGGPFFAELVPVQAGAARIVVLDPAGEVLLATRLEGAAPAITVTAPAGGGTVRGLHEIRWQVSDPDGGRHRFWVRYSPNGGALESWRTLGFVDEPRLRVDFDRLPGSAGRAVVQVVASDGVNSTAATSAAFTVPSAGPEVHVTFPAPGAVFRRSHSIWLQGAAFDDEDGTLEGQALTWRSDRDGLLGHGESVAASDLSPGLHTLTLTARDSDGNTARGEVRVTVAGAGPTLDLEVEALDSLPTTCAEVTLSARPGSVGLKRVEYSLDGGQSWTAVPLSRLPHRFIVPGSGFFHLVARAFDHADQLAADDARFFTDSVCRDATPAPPSGPWLTTREVPGFRFKARITSGNTSTNGRSEADCIDETLCLSGSLPGRSELFTRIIGPRPNGQLWVNLVRFTPSEVEVWIEQTASRQVNYYRLGALPQGGSTLIGLVDKEAFDPDGRPGRRPPAVQARLVGMPGVLPLDSGGPAPAPATWAPPSSSAREVVFRDPELPGYRFTVRIFSGGEIEARRERDCLAETACVSGAVPGRSEVFLRLIGPRPNGFLWVNLVRFTPSRVEVEIEQERTGTSRRYVLPAIDRESSALDGLVDTNAFRP